jgi:L-arabinonolactonase
MRIHRIATSRCLGGESPWWDPAGQALYFIDNTGRKVHRYDVATAVTRSWDMPSVITALALRARGGAVLTLRTGIHSFDFETGTLHRLSPLDDPPPFVFNDGKVDRRGRFLIGASTANFAQPTPDGGLYRLDPDHRLTQLDSGIHFSNGPCWSPDDKTFYFSDSFRYETYAYDYDIATGEVANRRVFVNTRDLGGLPDGATVDRDGLVWMALYGGGKIAAFRPDGRLEHTIHMPVRLVSSVMFGGADLDQLYVTTIEKGALGEPFEEGAGDVYLIEGIGARGLSEPRYGG